VSNFQDFVSVIEGNVGREIPTIGGRSLFILERDSRGVVVIPLSTNIPRRISFSSLQDFFEEYQTLRSKSPSVYGSHSRNASYVLALIKIYEDKSHWIEGDSPSKIYRGDIGTTKINLVSEISFPVWSILHYLERLSQTYFKLLAIQRVCDALARGCKLEDIVVFERSADLISTNPFVFNEGEIFRQLGSESTDYKQFWGLIKKIHRPMVFVRDRGGYRSLFDIRNDDLIINKLVVSSPPNITVSGIGGAVADIYYAAEREERKRQEHRGQQINQAVRNIGEIAETRQKIGEVRISDGHREYLDAILDDLLSEQVQLQRQMGMQSKRIDTRA
jgi:hypothetical protein